MRGMSAGRSDQTDVPLQDTGLLQTDSSSTTAVKPKELYFNETEAKNRWEKGDVEG